MALLEPPQIPNAFHPLRDMSLEGTAKKDPDLDEFTSMPPYSSNEHRHLTMPKQQHIESWLDGSEFESSGKRCSSLFDPL